MIWNTDTLACGGDCVFTTTLKDDQGQDAEAGKYPQRKTALERPAQTVVVPGDEMEKTGT
ncbi:hypothetical protein [Allobaculum sp. Allo2]|nr:hypothetical protein [Allobaculum sp. Allo2]UNT92427.1 hypothetical protein KWG61_09610 [Allobaculum sp. Allo2]